VLRHNGAFVFRINEDNNAEQVTIDIGDSEGNMIAVSGSLREGDRVAIRGAENLRDGSNVRVLSKQASSQSSALSGG
jgi:multidrug efflux pump subunit AcrA (membrane-fusion protein)